jgi:hypothetical protein
MASPRVMQASRTYPVAVDAAYEYVVLSPLEELLGRRYGPIPPIRSTEGPADWGTTGQVRTIRLADGGSIQEELTHVDRPHTYAYLLRDITGPMKPLASHVEGLWVFVPAGTGTRITWTWTVHPRSAFSAAILPAFGWLWRRYAQSALDRMEKVLVPA